MTEVPRDLEKLSPAERRNLLQQLLRSKAEGPRSAPLSLAQERLWFLAQAQPGDPFYNVTALILLSGELDSDALEKTLSEIVRRHETLRTTFRSVNGTPEQLIAPGGEPFLTVRRLDDIVSGRRPAEVRRLARRESERPFDLERGPLARFVLLRLDPREHVLVITMHHIVSDGWSVYNLMREIAALYRSFQQGVAPVLPPLPIQYADFARWQRRWIRTQECERQRDYWIRRLSELPVLALPTDRSRPAIQRFRGANRSLAIPAELSEAVREIARANGVTLFTTLMAAFDVLLTRYTGQTDIVVGTPVAARSRTETETLIGFFVNVLVLRTDTSGAPTFRELLRRVHQDAIDAFSNQELPFEKLVEELKPERDLSRNPLFQVAFTVQNMPEPGLELPGLKMSPPTLPGFTAGDYEVGTSRTRVDMEWHLMDRPQGIDGTVAFDSDLFDPETVERMIGHFLTLVAGAVRSPDTPISRLPLLTTEEKRRILVEWNDTARSYPDDKCFHQIFEEQALNRPEQTAATFGRTRVTYSELNSRANRLAHYLRQRGVGVEVPVGIYLNRSLEMIVALLAILKAGGAYVPLESSYPAERLRFILEDTAAPLIVTREELRSRLPRSRALVVDLERERSQIDAQSSENPEPLAQPDDLAYVIFTSGSTGEPKGVLVRHRGMVNLSRAMQEAFALDPSDRVLQFASLGYDASVWELVMAFTFGARLCLGAQESMIPGPALMQLLEEQGVSAVTMPPSVLAGLQPERLARLRLVVAAGEASSPELVARWSSGRQFFNAYGPTETTVCATIAQCRPEDPWLTIGKPLANFRCYVLDGASEPVPVGVSGELCVGGEGLARGYLNRPDLTSHRFIPDPFARGDERDPRLYRTGDLVRFRPDGNIEYLGRIDEQVKVRAFRVEPGEVEKVLESHPGVKEALVMHRAVGSSGKALVAYWVANEGSDPSASSFKKFLREKLPEFMVPPHFIRLSAFPLTANGKVDRNALPEPGIGSSPESAFAAPRSDIEERVADIWKGLLHVDRVGRNDSFFDLGGHSLLLVRLHDELRAAFGQEISILDLFKLPTVEALASRIAASRNEPRRDLLEKRIESASAARDAVAVIAVGGRFPGAPSVARFWENLCRGVESVRFFEDEELERSGVEPSVYRKPNYVRARAVLEDVDLFDASFFGYSAGEAELIDPQHRLFLECAWELLETAGYDPSRYRGAIGVFAGAGRSDYLAGTLDALGPAASIGTLLGNDKDFLPTRVSYKLDLRGPSVDVQTACSTSLVAVHLAAQSLLLGDGDMALAGGVNVELPQERGYLHQEGGIASPDGHCRPFDADARGAVGGNGVGLVLLKRLEDAIADGDGILAVIKGSAINNDGGHKVGYTAPGFDGQAAVIDAALARAGFSPETISYIEAHGTGTLLGDAVEIEALTQVFRDRTSKTGFCALGSVKSNIGHLNAAAGIASMIKAVLALHHKTIPPSLHFQKPNPNIDFRSGPFYVGDGLRPWAAGPAPRRAGVNSFGLGGTNAHVLLEEAPPMEPSGPSRGWQCLLVSAKTSSALDRVTSELIQYLDSHPEVPIADVAFTLQVGRVENRHRRALLCRDARDAVRAWSAREPGRIFEGSHDGRNRPVAFLFPGSGEPCRTSPGRELYETESTYREHVDYCCERLSGLLGLDVLASMFSSPDRRPGEAEASAEVFRDPGLGLAALFVSETALAELWMEWGVTPEWIVAEGEGQHAAAYCAGTLSLDDSLERVAEHGRLLAERGAEPSDRLSKVRSRFERKPAGRPLFSWGKDGWTTEEPSEGRGPWSRRLSGARDFREGLSLLFETPECILLEVGSGEVLERISAPAGGIALPSLPRNRAEPEARSLVESLARLWVSGITPAWSGVYRHERRRRVPLPTYPFERKRYFRRGPGLEAGSPRLPRPERGEESDGLG